MPGSSCRMEENYKLLIQDQSKAIKGRIHDMHSLVPTYCTCSYGRPSLGSFTLTLVCLSELVPANHMLHMSPFMNLRKTDFWQSLFLYITQYSTLKGHPFTARALQSFQRKYGKIDGKIDSKIDGKIDGITVVRGLFC